MDVSRRTLGQLLIASAAALPVAAAPQSNPAQPSEETQSAHDALRNNAQQIATVDLPMRIEPAFQFKAL